MYVMWIVVIIIISVVVVWVYTSSKRAEREREEAKKKSDRIAQIKRDYPNAYHKYWGVPIFQYKPKSTDSVSRKVDETLNDTEWAELEKRVLQELARRKAEKEQEERKKADKDWETAQTSFASNIRAIAGEILSSYGNYTYTYSIKTKNGSQLNMKVWQHFLYDTCLEKDLDYSYNRQTQNNTNSLPRLQKNGVFPKEDHVKQISNLISKIANEKKVLVFFNEVIEGWSVEALSNTYMHIELPKSVNDIDVASDRALEIDTLSGKELLTKESPECIVVIDAFTTNEQMKNNCEYIFNALQEKHPLLVYISLIKTYDRQEMIAYINSSKAKAEKRAAEERAKEEERKLIKQSSEDRKWEEEQKEFSSKVYNIAIKNMPNTGMSNYSINYDSVNTEGKPNPGYFFLWQFFPLEACLEEDLDYTNCASINNNNHRIGLFRKNGIKLDVASISTPINAFFAELATNWRCLFFFNDEIRFWSDEALDITYRTLKTPGGNCKTINIAKARIISQNLGLNKKYAGGKELLGNHDCEVIVIVDAFTANGQLFKNIQDILPLCRKYRPKIIYLSILKCYDRKEMLEIIRIKDEEAEKRRLEDKIKEEEKKRKEAESEKLAEKKRKAEERARLQCKAKDVLINNAKDWESLYGDFYYTWLFYYYPTTCDFEASESEWHDRRIIWNFKNDPDKSISSMQHEYALNCVIPQIWQRLCDTFGEEYLQFLTLVCLPASTKEKNAARYDEFSKWLCEKTGMENAYNHVHIVQDGMSKKDPRNTTGRSIQPVIEYDKDYFKGRYVLLFDDVVTKGGTMLRYKEAMEREGATVIGGLCLGKTKHERPPQPFPPQLETPKAFPPSANDDDWPF